MYKFIGAIVHHFHSKNVRKTEEKNLSRNNVSTYFFSETNKAEYYYCCFILIEETSVLPSYY